MQSVVCVTLLTVTPSSDYVAPAHGSERRVQCCLSLLCASSHYWLLAAQLTRSLTAHCPPAHDGGPQLPHDHPRRFFPSLSLSLARSPSEDYSPFHLFTLSQTLDRHTAKDVLRAVLHAILFHRLFGVVEPKIVDVLDVTVVRPSPLSFQWSN